LEEKYVLPLGEIPHDINSILEHYVAYAKEFHLNSEMKPSTLTIKDFVEKWDGIGKTCLFNNCNNKNNCEGCDNNLKRLSMLRSCSDSNHEYYNAWDLHTSNVSKVFKNLQTVLSAIKDKIDNKINDLCRQSSDNNLIQWQESPTRKKEKDGTDSDHYDFDPIKSYFDEMLKNKFDSDFNLESILDLKHESRRLRNAIAHSKECITYKVRKDDEANKTIKQYKDYFSLLKGVESLDHIRKILLNYLKLMGLGEEWSGLHEDGNFQFYCTRQETSSLVAETKIKNVKALLGLVEWSDYIPVTSKDEYDEEKPAIDWLIEYLRDINMVDINGDGGLGKTALSYEYIRRVTSGELQSTIDPYNHIIFLTSKSARQGEYPTERYQISDGNKTLNPRNPKLGIGTFIPGMAFITFLAKVCTYSSTNPHPTENNAIEILTNNRFLVVIDNFEDVDKEDKKRYSKFFRKINGGKSDVIITSRTEDKSNVGQKIKLDTLQISEANDLLVSRFRHMTTKNHFNYRKKDLDELLNIRERKEDLLGSIIDKAFKGKKEKDAFKLTATHPQALFYLVSLLGDQEIRKELEISGNTTISEYIQQIAKTPKFELLEYHKNLTLWSTRKAYDRVIQNKQCKIVLDILEGAPSTLAELQEEFSSMGEDVMLVSGAIQILECHQDTFISKEDSTYYLAEAAMRFLETVESPNDADLIKEIKKEPHENDSYPDVVVSDLETVQEILDLAEDYVKYIGKVRDFLNRKPNISSRKSIHIDTLNLSTDLALKLVSEGEYSSEGEDLSSLVCDVLFTCLKNDNCDNVYHADMGDIIRLSVKLMSIEKSDDILRKWVLYAGNDVNEILSKLSPEIKTKMFQLFTSNKQLLPRKDDVEEYILSWAKFVSFFSSYDFYLEEPAMDVIDTLAEHRIIHNNPIYDLFEDKLEYDELETITTLISKWTISKPWKYDYYELRNHFELDGENKAWSNATEWKTYRMLPPFTAEEIQEMDLPLMLYELDNDKVVELEPGYEYTASYSDTSPYTGIIKVRCIDKYQPKKKSLDESSLVEEKEVDDSLVTETIRILTQGINQSPENSYSHSELERRYDEEHGITIFEELDGTAFTSSSSFVVNEVIPKIDSFEAGIEVADREQPTQHYRITKPSTTKTASEIEEENIGAAKTWITSTNRGDLGYLYDSSAARKLIVDISKSLRESIFDFGGQSKDFADRFKTKLSGKDKRIQSMSWICAFYCHKYRNSNPAEIQLSSYLIQNLERKIRQQTHLSPDVIKCIREWSYDILESTLSADKNFNNRCPKCRKHSIDSSGKCTLCEYSTSAISSSIDDSNKGPVSGYFSIKPEDLSILYTPTWLKFQRKALTEFFENGNNFTEYEEILNRHSKRSTRVIKSNPLWWKHYCKLKEIATKVLEDELENYPQQENLDVDEWIIKILKEIGCDEEVVRDALNKLN